MELRDADVRTARFVDGLDEQLLDVPEALLAKKLEVAAGHEAALAGLEYGCYLLLLYHPMPMPIQDMEIIE